MGNNKSIRCPGATTPQDDIEIENARAPPAAAPHAKRVLHSLKACKKPIRRQPGFEDQCAIGILPARGAHRGAINNCGAFAHDAKFTQHIRGCCQHRIWRTKFRMANIGAERDQIGVGQISSTNRPYSWGRRSRKKPMPARCLAAMARSKAETSTPSSFAPNSHTRSPHSLAMKL